MIRRRHQQLAIAQLILLGVVADPESLMDPLLKRIDETLDDEDLVETVVEALRKRHPQSATRGRRGTPAVVVLRMLVLRRLKDWTFDDLEREVKGSIVYRFFCRIDGHKVPDAKTLIRLERVLDGPILRRIFERVLSIAVEKRVAHGFRARVDTTVVEAPIRHPTDSRLLEDAVRVLSRHARRIVAAGVDLARPLRRRFRSVQRRAREIASILRQRGEEARRALKQPYQRLVAITRAAIRDAVRAARGAKLRLGRVDTKTRAKLTRNIDAIATFVPRAQAVVRQTCARILRGVTNSKEKIISIFEPYAQILRRGKPHRPTEFGMLVKVQEADGGLITDVGEVPEKADAPLLVPSIEHHCDIFGHAPYVVATDRGFFSFDGEEALKKLGVRTVATPKPGHRSKQRLQYERRRSFCRARAWRAGGEARIAHLKHDFGMGRARSKGPTAIFRTIHWAAIANNLMTIARRGPP